MTAMLMTRTVPTEEAVSSRATLWWARIVCLLVFGPYVTGSARTEQIAVFASFAVILVVGWPQIMQARSFTPMPFFIAWCGLYAVMLIGTISRPFDPYSYGAQPASHALAPYLMPLALITLTWFWTLRATTADLLGAIAPVITGAMALNTVVSLAQLISRQVAVVSFLPRFWGAPGAVRSVAALAAENGRYTGIFDQPAEAGIAYGIALLCLIYLTQRRRVSGGMTAVCAALLITGGILTVSKVFLLGALPLAVLMMLRGPRRIRAALWAVTAAAAAWLLAGLLPAWPVGSAAVLRLLHPAGSVVTEYTAGRYGTGGSLGAVAGDVLHASPWYGFGAGGLDVAYDSQWVQALALAGLAGVILVASVLLMLAYRWARLRGSLGRPERNLAGAVLVLTAGGCLGFPVLTGNCDATLAWLILGVLLTSSPPRMTGGSLPSPAD